MWTIEYLLPYKTKLQHSVDQPWHDPGLKVVPVVIQVENFDWMWHACAVHGRNWPKCLEMGLTFTSQLWPQDMGESKPKVNQWKDPTVETDSSLFFVSTGMHWQHTISFLVGVALNHAMAPLAPLCYWIVCLSLFDEPKTITKHSQTHVPVNSAW